MNHPIIRIPSRLVVLGVLAITALLSGCGTTKLPSAQLTSTLATANETVSQARAVDAQQYAPLELQMAEQKMRAAQIALSENDHERAGQLATEAMVDARLAAIKSRSAEKRAVVLELQQSIQALKDEIKRSAKG